MKKTAILALAMIASIPSIKAQTEFLPEQSNRISLGYNAEFLIEKHNPTSTMHGFAVQYDHLWRISQQQPLYFGAGAKLTTNFYSDSEVLSTSPETKGEAFLVSLSLGVPLNILYGIKLSDAVTFYPYTGLDTKLNLLGEGRFTFDRYKKYFNVYEKYDVGDEHWRRFQMGWHLGFGFSFGRYFASAEYGYDFLKLSKSTHSSHLGLSLAISF